MKKLDIVDLYKSYKKLDKKEVTLAGWIRSVRDMKQIAFIDFVDGTSFKGVQIVMSKDIIKEYDEIAKLVVSSSIIVVGKVKVTPDAKQPFEVEATDIKIVGKADADYPLQKKGHTMDFLREQAYLRPRTSTFSAVFRIRSKASLAVHRFFEERDFTYLHAPILTTSDCEGGCAVFGVTTQDIYSGKQLKPEDELLGKKVFLTPTGQLEGEAFALAMGKIYTFGPTFRAEDSRTTRHMVEFWHIEPEIAFYELEDLYPFMEEFIKYIIKDVMEKCPDELAFLDRFVSPGLIEKLKTTLETDFGKVSYEEAIKILKDSGVAFEHEIFDGAEIHTEHEKYLTEKVFKKPIFLYGYPKEQKAFYMKIREDGKTVKGSDLLVPGIGELCGASEREEDITVLKQIMKEKGLKEEDYWWYLKLRQYGTVKHSGFGMGFDRLIMFLTGVSTIKDSIPFPRTPGSCEF